MQCKRCSRALRNGKSLERGYGITCWRHHLDELEEQFLKMQMTIDDLLPLSTCQEDEYRPKEVRWDEEQTPESENRVSTLRCLHDHVENRGRAKNLDNRSVSTPRL